MSHLVLEKVEPFVLNPDDSVFYRSCDYCCETAVEDIWAGKRDESQWRTFYLLPCQTCVCSNCLEKGAVDNG